MYLSLNFAMIHFMSALYHFADFLLEYQVVLVTVQLLQFQKTSPPMMMMAVVMTQLQYSFFIIISGCATTILTKDHHETVT